MSEEYWQTVQECLVRFHGNNPEHLQRLTSLKDRVSHLDETTQMWQWHQEPFYCANHLAQNNLDVRNYLQEYLMIRDGELPVEPARPPEDPRRVQTRTRAKLIGDAYFLMNKAMHRLQRALEHYDTSLEGDFDESQGVANALKFLEMAYNEIEGHDYNMDVYDRISVAKPG